MVRGTLKIMPTPVQWAFGRLVSCQVLAKDATPATKKNHPFFQKFPNKKRVQNAVRCKKSKEASPPKWNLFFFQRTTTFPKCLRLCFLFEVGDLSRPKLISFAEGLIKVSSSHLPGRRSTKQRWQRLAGSSRKNMSRLMFFNGAFLQMQQTTVYIFLGFKKYVICVYCIYSCVYERVCICI